MTSYVSWSRSPSSLRDRHLAMAKDWMSHEYAPWSLGRDFDVEPWATPISGG
jgi:hypothetical protein